MTPGQEIERKFRVGENPPLDLGEHPSEVIRQGYIAIAPDGTEVRVGARGGRDTITVKSGPLARAWKRRSRSKHPASTLCGR